MNSRILPAILLLSLGIAPAPLLAGAHKKGIGEYDQPYAAATLAELRVSWYYDWKPRQDVSGPPPDVNPVIWLADHGGVRGGGAPPSVQFIPMIWGKRNLNAADLRAAKATGAGILLGFNEPNEKKQSNMTVQQALNAWPKLEALHMRLGSPAPGTGDDIKPDGWLARFMAGVKARGYRVDFICIHPYQSSFDPAQATRDLVNEVTTVHNMYHLPIWVTEYAMAQWGPPQKTPSAAVQAEFAQESAAALDQLPFVERYAWFGDLPNWPAFATNNANGTLTPVGQAWSTAPND